MIRLIEVRWQWMIWMACVAGLAWPASAQDAARVCSWGPNVIVPQCWRTTALPTSPLRLTQIAADIEIRDQSSQTTLVYSIKNESGTQQMAEFLIPVAPGTIVRGFTFDGVAQEPKTELLEKDLARAAFESIVAKLRDPALLEFAGYNLIRSSVFPVPAAGEQKVRLVIEQLLNNDNHRIDYYLPRSQSVIADVPWSIQARIRSSRDIATVYSPSHEVAVRMVSKQEATLSVPDRATGNPGPFRLSYLQASGPLSASLMTYPNRDGHGGYFLLLAGLGQATEQALATAPKIRREITLVLDRSGSMQGEKIEQARQAAWQVLSGLEMGEAFNIITFNDQIEAFSQSPVVKTAETLERARLFIESVRAENGTNLHDSLAAALIAPATPEFLPIVLFLTDGLATVGTTSELAIREVAEKQNPHQRRIFTFGVGFDVNTPLLDKLATATRGFSTFVTHGEDVEVAVSRVFRGLAGPMYSNVRLTLANQPLDQPQRVFDMLPTQLPDLYSGDQLIVMGRYRGDDPLTFAVTAARGDQTAQFEFTFDMAKQSGGQPFVARLWASRKIAQLIDQVRDLGAESPVASGGLAASVPSPTHAAPIDSRLAELTQSIVALSKEFGILTEYTAFLAEEGVDLSNAETVTQLTQQQLVDRAMHCRSGTGSWNQEYNKAFMRDAACLNLSNRFVDSQGQWVATVTVQQCSENTLYRRNGRWVESRFLDEPEQAVPHRVIEFGSSEFLKILWRLVREQRQDELALSGDVMITVGDEAILIKGVPNDQEKQE